MADSTPQSATANVTNGASATTPPTVAVTTPTIQQIAPTFSVMQPSQPAATPSAITSVGMSSSAAVAPQPTANSSAAQSTAGTSAVSDNLFKINRDLKEKAVKEQAARFGYGYIDIEKIPINPDLASVFYESEAIKALCIPFFRVGKKLRVALFDPKKEETVQLLESLKQKGYLLNINLASDEGIKSIIDRLYAATRKYAAQEIVTQVSEADIQAYEKEIQNLGELKNKLQTITSEEALNLINVGAIKTGASDIHIQPEEKNAILRFRIDGVLQKIFEMDLKIFANITNQLKYKSGMKLNITNVPQDGRFYFVINQRKIDVRVSALPTEFGETFVLRLLDSGKGFLAFDQCGFIGRNLELMNKSVQISHGMILATGPTGSGKTTTLYSLLNQFNSPQVKIITLEDPIEYHLPGISQSQINEKRGYNFADGLRSILRQDPDIVMVGEIRDRETAETAAQAALTGHILLSTLHTNSAIETIPRLINIGLVPFMVAPSLHMVIAQRLVRKLCLSCRKKSPITEVERKELEETCSMVLKLQPGASCTVPAELWHAGECDKCSHTGYSGQMGIHEILVVDDPIRELILQNAPSNAIFMKAREQGMTTMREDGLMKVMQEITTLEEVQRVTQLL